MLQVLDGRAGSTGHELLIQFADVFATHDLDVGCFTVFAHRIKTGKAFPLWKSMKRTPLGFDPEKRKIFKSHVGRQGHQAESVRVGVASDVSAQAGWDLALLLGFPWP